MQFMDMFDSPVIARNDDPGCGSVNCLPQRAQGPERIIPERLPDRPCLQQWMIGRAKNEYIDFCLGEFQCKPRCEGPGTGACEQDAGARSIESRSLLMTILHD
jgi:hypothetical protein